MSSSAYTIYDTTGQAWTAMYKAIENATSSIYWEVYIFVDDKVGTRFFDLLEEKAGQGVEVKLIIDYWGSFALSRKRVNRLKGKGIDVLLFQERKPRYKTFWKRFSIRTHRKVLIIDQRLGFIGGVNIQKDMNDWLDLHMCIRGTVVKSLLRSFARLYVLSGGKKEKIRHILRSARFRPGAQQDQTRMIYDQPRGRYSRARKKYLEALRKASKQVILFSPYYFLDAQFLKALWKAKKRGVRVDLLIPLRTDLRLATYAAFAWFALLKRAGVRIHILKKMMHGKGLIVDEDWAMIGSSNIDHPSFYHNYEANIRLKDKRVVRKLKRIALRWIGSAHSLDDLRWQKRGFWHKLKERLAMKGYAYWFDIEEQITDKTEHR